MSKMRFFALQELANRRPLPVDYPSEKLSEYYGAHVFDRKKMQEFLPQEAYKAVINAIEKGVPFNREMADMIANGMKSWAKTFNVTGSNPLRTERQRSMTDSSNLMKTEMSSNASRASSSSSRSRMHRASRTEVSETPSKPVVIRLGTCHPQPSS